MTSGPEIAPATLLAMLGFASGAVDALSYLALGQVFTANMTGNTVLLGIATIGGDATRVARSGCALGGFCAGAALATFVLARRPAHQLWPRVVTLALATEALLLAALAAASDAFGAGDGNAYWLIALAGVAMGLQSAAVRVVAISGVNTTYITGMLTKLVADATAALVPGARSRAPAPNDEPRATASAEQEPSGLRLPALVWLAYLGAALATAAATKAWGVSAAWIPSATVSAVALAAWLARGRLSREPARSEPL